MKNGVALAKSSLRSHQRVILHLLLLLLVPNLASLIFGLEYSKQPYQDIPIVIVNQDDSATARNLVQMIADNSTFQVMQYGTDEQTIQHALYEGSAAAGILIPKDFSQNILNGQEAKVMLFQDGALSPPVGNVRTTINMTLSTVKAGYLIKIAEGKLGMSPGAAQSAVVPMGYTSLTIGNPTGNIAFMTVEGLLLTILQVGVAVTGAAVCEGGRYGRFFGKGMLVAAIGTISGIYSVQVQYFVFKIPYKGSIAVGIGMLFLICMGFAFFGMFFNRFSKGNSTSAISKCLVINLTFMFSGYTYPVVSMSAFFQHFAWLIPNNHFILPLRDIALMGEDVVAVLPQILWLTGFAGLMFVLATLLFFVRRMQSQRVGQTLTAAAENEVQTA